MEKKDHTVGRKKTTPYLGILSEQQVSIGLKRFEKTVRENQARAKAIRQNQAGRALDEQSIIK